MVLYMVQYLHFRILKFPLIMTKNGELICQKKTCEIIFNHQTLGFDKQKSESKHQQLRSNKKKWCVWVSNNSEFNQEWLANQFQKRVDNQELVLLHVVFPRKMKIYRHLGQKNWCFRHHGSHPGWPFDGYTGIPHLKPWTPMKKKPKAFGAVLYMSNSLVGEWIITQLYDMENHNF